MDIAAFKTEFRAGALKEAQIMPGYPDGWRVMIRHADTGDLKAVERQRGHLAEYQSIDAAFAAVRRIGFLTAKIIADPT